MYKHIIWDFDGTLFDTYPAMSAAFREALKTKLGINEKIEDVNALMKVSLGRTYNFYNQKYVLNDDFFNEFNSLRVTYEESDGKPYKGIIELCRYICDMGGYNYLFTHRDKSALSMLKKFGLYELFTGFVIHEDGFLHKPNPDGINYLVKKHKIPFNEAIMAGDREIDVLSGKNAGIAAVLFTENKQVKTCADFIITDFNEMYAILNLDENNLRRNTNG